ncbi:MAG: hypothetical protein KatS3mg057_2854 [Herpetosiphonaceae bacterium]|nr:MAG: hypothetical protein KatS3mg057_2854 [Herpetosiphonaceae bacterium]
MLTATEQRIGEIIEASTTSFTAGTYRFLEAPPFGSLVRANVRDGAIRIYGLVYDIRTSSREPGGRAAVRGGPRYDGQEFYDEEVYREHPDLQEVLQTEFSALVVGFEWGDGRIRHYLPPQPATVHYSVFSCAVSEVLRFTESCDFFRTILYASQIPADDLLAAAVRRAAAARKHDRSYLLCAGRELARLLKDDYDRLRSLLRRIGD